MEYPNEKKELNYFQKLKPYTIKRVNLYIKIFICFLTLILAIALMATEAWGYNFLVKNNMLYHTQKDGTREYNPDLVWMLLALGLFCIATVVSLVIVIQLFRKKNINFYKFTIFPFIIVLIGFFLPIQNQLYFKGMLIASNQLSTFMGDFKLYANLGTNSITILSVLGLLYLTSIAFIISFNALIEKYKK